MIYLQIPYSKHVARAIAKHRGATWSSYMQLWQIDTTEQYLPHKLRRYIKYDDNNPETYGEKIDVKVKPSYNIGDLSVREIKFLQALIASNGDTAAAAVAINCTAKNGPSMAHRVLKKPAAKQWLDTELSKLSEEARWTFEEKIKVLKQIVKAAVPEGETNIANMVPAAAISAIAESNKMAGHYSAEKHLALNVEVDTDIEEVKQLTAELLDKNKREY